MKSLLTKTGFLFAVLLFMSCNSEPSLQRYIVDSSEDPAFQNISLSPESLIKNTEALSKEDKEQLENITKLNVLMLQNKNEDDTYTIELQKVMDILKQEQYRSLFSAGEPNKRMEMLYVGKEDQIKEIIIFGSDEKMGFVLARILGDDLNPNNLYKIMKMADKMDFSELEETVKKFTDS